MGYCGLREAGSGPMGGALEGSEPRVGRVRTQGTEVPKGRKPQGAKGHPGWAPKGQDPGTQGENSGFPRVWTYRTLVTRGGRGQGNACFYTTELPF